MIGRERTDFSVQATTARQVIKRTAIAVLLAMGMLLPRRPTSATGWVAYVAILAAFALLGQAGIGLIRWLLRQERHPMLCKGLALFVAIVPGVAFLLLLKFELDFISANFR